MSDAQPIALIPFEIQKAQAFEQSRKAAAEAGMDTTVPGGRYAASDGTIVDCDGKPVQESAKAEAKPEPAEGETPARRSR